MAIPSACTELPPGKRFKALWLLPGLLVLAYLILWAAGAFLVVGDRVRPVDVIVLLSGGDEARLEEAVRLYKSGTSNRLLITETGAIPEGGGPRASASSMGDRVPSGKRARDRPIVPLSTMV